MKILKFLSAIFFVLGLTSCGPDYLIREKLELDEMGWNYEDVKSVDFDITDTLAIYNLVVKIKHTADYPYQNVYVKVHTEFPTGEKREEQISFDLYNNVGLTNGKCRGGNCTAIFDLQKQAFFNLVGKHRLTFEQYTRTPSLVGLQNIQFEVIETKDRRSVQ